MENVKNEKYVGIGKVMVGMAPEVLYAVVGSCLAVTLYNSRLKLGGMAHILMAGKDLSDTKYVKPAIEHLITSLKSYGNADTNWLAKIAGGSLIIRSDNALVVNTGRQTALQALEILIEKQYDIVGMHVGGDCRRAVHLDLQTGDMTLKIEGSRIFDNTVLKI